MRERALKTKPERPNIEKMRRATLEAYIEQMIASVDRLDGDADLEDTGDDEPSLLAMPRYIGKTAFYELEEDPAEHGLADQDSLDLFMHEGGFGFESRFDGSGNRIACDQLRSTLNGRQLFEAHKAHRDTPDFGSF